MPPLTGKQECHNWTNRDSCRYGSRCRFEHIGAGNKATQQLAGVCAACSSKSHGISQCPVHAKQLQRKAARDAGKERDVEAKEAKAQLATITSDLASMKAMFAGHTTPSAIPASFAHQAQSTPSTHITDPAIEIQRLQGQLAAALSANQYYSFAGPAGP